MSTFTKTLLILLQAIMLSACSVKYSFTGADIPAAAETFSVKTFQVITPLTDATYGLSITESLKDLLLAQTKLNLTSGPGDLQYEGAVTGYNVSTAAVSGDETASLNRLTITLKVKYINTFDNSKNFDKTFSRFADFGSNENFTSVEVELVDDINAQLTQDIFDASLGAW